MQHPATHTFQQHGSKRTAILANFQTLNNMVRNTGHYDISPKLPIDTSTAKPSKVEGKQRKARSLFELLFGVSTASVAKKVILAPHRK